MIWSLVIGAVLAFLFMVAIAFWAYQAGALAARRDMARSQGSVTLGGALKAYTLAMIALIGSIVALAAILEMVLAA